MTLLPLIDHKTSPYFQKFPNINDFMKSTVDKAKKLGYVENLFGRKSHIKDINTHHSQQ